MRPILHCFAVEAIVEDGLIKVEALVAFSNFRTFRDQMAILIEQISAFHNNENLSVEFFLPQNVENFTKYFRLLKFGQSGKTLPNLVTLIPINNTIGYISG